MMDIKVPTFPESVAEGTLATWHKSVGDHVEEGEVIAEIETDKVMMEVPAVSDGVLKSQQFQEGDTVTSEAVIGQMESGQAASNTPDEMHASKAENTASSQPTTMTVSAPAFPESVSEGTVATWHKQVGDQVEEGETLVEIETDKVMMEVPATQSGTLSKQLVAEGDTLTSQQQVADISVGQSGSVAAPSESDDHVSDHQSTSSQDLSPSARRAAQTTGVDTASIQGSGKKGRITKSDIHQASSESVSQRASSQSEASEPMVSGQRPETRVRMTRLRQTIAKRLVEVQQTNAILSTFNEVDMKPVMDMRKKYKDIFQQTHDTKLGFMSFFLKAATEALKAYPEVNASIDGQEVVYHGYFDIGVAVGTDRGLVVPVLRDIDQMSFAEIEAQIIEKAKRAQSGKLGIDEMQGGTFTVTNGGTYGSMLSTPIINAPQSAILGMHNIVKRPVVENDEIVIRPMMYLALSYDHRIIDGATSVRFLKMIKELIEDPARMLLQV